jgi:hypothetical protein
MAVIHLSDVRRNLFDGITTNSLCRRSRVTDDGMNLTGKPSEVTCKFCLKLINKKLKLKGKLK